MYGDAQLDVDGGPSGSGGLNAGGMDGKEVCFQANHNTTGALSLEYAIYETWDWEKDCYLPENPGFDVSHFMNDTNRDESNFLYMLDDHTPVKDCIDLHCGEMNIDCTSDVSDEIREPSHMKRRRMLNFSCDPSGAAVFDEPAVLKSKARDDPLTVDGFLENSLWNSALPEDCCSLGDEVHGQSSEGWLSKCLDINMPDESNYFSATSRQVDASVASFNTTSDVGRSDAVAQSRRNSSTCKILRGKKAYMTAPISATTSVAYPFTLIKPGGVQEGGVTLTDINQRILAPPPSKFGSGTSENDAAVAYPTSAFSGKPVVAKTKIRTEKGMGSITIVRTKG